MTPDDLDAVLDVRKRAFGLLSAAEIEAWRAVVGPVLSQGRYLGAFDGTRLAAAARVRPFTQWWYGRPQPMAGVAGVTVNPEDRGRGVGTTIMKAVVRRALDLGDAVSALYPATTPIYRGLGFEHAGAQYSVPLPTEALRTIRPRGQVKLRRMGPDDAPELLAILHRVHAATRASGPIAHSEETLRRILAEPDDFRYIADDGFVIYGWSDSGIKVDHLVAGSEETARALWSIVGSSSSMAKTVTAHLAPDDPVRWLLRERSTEQVHETRWMFRVLDVAEAVARRGFPAEVPLDAVLTVDDPLLADNSRSWRLEVSGGVGAAVPSVEEGARLTINGLSALYCGVPTSTLRLGGLMSGDERYDAALDAAFSGRPYMLDYF
ncbi:MAG: GNAT family N-acetyltransferase [Nonomuraea sp.]|nr:GNAT family N-acetyltransferase [Nonomuraea sp.]